MVVDVSLNGKVCCKGLLSMLLEELKEFGNEEIALECKEATLFTSYSYVEC